MSVPIGRRMQHQLRVLVALQPLPAVDQGSGNSEPSLFGMIVRSSCICRHRSYEVQEDHDRSARHRQESASA